MKVQAIVLLLSTMFLNACSNADQSGSGGAKVARNEDKFYNGIGIGPVQQLSLPSEIDVARVAAGEVLYREKCASCHKLSDEKLIGPGLSGITERRRPEYIMNMILNPMEMTQKDSLAKELLSIYYSQMLDNDLTEAEARNILEFLRK